MAPKVPFRVLERANGRNEDWRVGVLGLAGDYRLGQPGGGVRWGGSQRVCAGAVACTVLYCVDV